MSNLDFGNLLLRASSAATRLTVEEEHDLVLGYRAGDNAALGRLVIANVRLAVARAHALRGYGLQADDLVQEGIVGLLEAAARFDVGRELRFSTYAGWWIKATTMDFVLRNWSIVRAPMSGDQKTLFFNLHRLKARLLRDPSLDPASVRSAVASALGVSERDVGLMEVRLGGDVSLNAPAPWSEDGDVAIGDTLPDSGPAPDDLAFGAIEDDDRQSAMRAALGLLDDRERLVIQERWLVDDVAPLCALAEFLGVSTSTVKRIELAAIAKMQAASGAV